MKESKFVQANEKIAEAVVDGYKKIEDTVVGAYQKVEDGFVDKFLTHEGETTEDAKKRLAGEQVQREAAAKDAKEERSAGIQAGTHVATDIGKASVEKVLKLPEPAWKPAEMPGNTEIDPHRTAAAVRCGN